MTAAAPRQPLWLRWWVADALVIAICVLAIAAAFLLSPGAERVAILGWEIPEVCAVKNLTGLPCPGCGLTRSWVYLAHGDPWTAVTMNVLGPVLFLAAIVQVPLRAWRIIRTYRERLLARSEGEGTCPA